MINEPYYTSIIEKEIINKSREQKAKALLKARKGKKKVSKNMYFTLETENAIILYNKETNQIVKNKIYNTYIQYPLAKLVENIFNRFGFSYFDSHPVDVMAGSVSFILLNLHKFKEGKGKAFSYFSIVCKNYLIQLNNKNHEKWKNRETLISAMPENWDIEGDSHIQERQAESNEFIIMMMDFWNTNVNSIFQKKRDIEIAQAVLELFRKKDNLELFNKKALYCYIREMTGCKTSHITKVIKMMKEIVHQLLMEYTDTGDIIETREKYNNMFWSKRNIEA